jgi:hypothetical protein
MSAICICNPYSWPKPLQDWGELVAKATDEAVESGGHQYDRKYVPLPNGFQSYFGDMENEAKKWACVIWCKKDKKKTAQSNLENEV